MRTAALVLALTLCGCALLPGAGPPSATRQQAQTALDDWAEFVAKSPPDTVVFIHDLTQGGGWNGSHADDAKIAFLGGAVEATVDLPAQQPAPGEVLWSDGTRQEVPLISAAAALARMVAELSGAGGKCEGCPALQVVGATLTTRRATTSRGDAEVPVWQFDFAPGEEPIDPISYVALKDRVSPSDWGSAAYTSTILGAAGKQSDSQITITYVGGQCDASHSIETVESTAAIAAIIATTVRPGPCTAAGVTYALVAPLGAPLGNRVVLDAGSGYPVPVYPEPPPDWPRP